jgi:hypothetical protein
VIERRRQATCPFATFEGNIASGLTTVEEGARQHQKIGEIA